MMQTVFTQLQFPLLLSSLSICVIHLQGSPLSDGNSSACPRGWYQYEQFCVTRGEGSTDRAIALYCDGFGGIGIKGLCIIKKSKIQPSSDIDLRSATSSEVDSFLSPQDSSPSSYYDMDIFGNNVDADDGLCPNGWAHFKNMCVYKPWSITTTCHLMDSVEFHGLCVKHADMKTVAIRNVEDNVKHPVKRICCCANFRARGNNYGC